MLLAITEQGWDDYAHWQQHDPKRVARINELLKDAMRHPFTGVGKPDLLKGGHKDLWSRRINHKHRLVYALKGQGDDQILIVAQCRFRS